MQDDVAEKLTALASCQEPLSESEVSHFLTLCRKYLDHTPRDESVEYPILKFFSNWALHITIDRSREGMEILKRLNDMLVEVASIPNNDVVTSRLTVILSFPQLRREIGELQRAAGLFADDPRCFVDGDVPGHGEAASTLPRVGHRLHRQAENVVILPHQLQDVGDGVFVLIADHHVE